MFVGILPVFFSRRSLLRLEEQDRQYAQPYTKSAQALTTDLGLYATYLLHAIYFFTRDLLAMRGLLAIRGLLVIFGLPAFTALTKKGRTTNVARPMKASV